jgi:hypothetical protein
VGTATFEKKGTGVKEEKESAVTFEAVIDASG